MVNMLCQMHVSQTLTMPPPFTFSMRVTIDKLSENKFIEVTKNKDSFDKFVKLCMDKFNEKYPTQPYGSVHCNPVIWTNIALSTIQKFFRGNISATEILFPNGCCTVPDCPINKYYAVVLNELIM